MHEMTRQFLATLLCLFTLSTAARAAQGVADFDASISPAVVQPGGSGSVTVTASVPEGLHAQSSKPLTDDLIAFRIAATADGVTFDPPQYPVPIVEADAQLGQLSIYRGVVTTTIPFHVSANAAGGDVPVAMKVTYQLCEDHGPCYFPQRKTLAVTLRIGAKGISAKGIGAKAAPLGSSAGASSGPMPATMPTELPAIGITQSGISGLWQALTTALIAGLIFNVMPCVLPVLPLKAMGFYEVSQHHRLKCFSFGLVFSLGVIAVFSLLAVPVLVLKLFSWGELFARPLFVWPLVGLLVAMAIGLFGGFATNLPSGIYSLSPRHDTYGGNFMWGGLTAVLATPCTAPLLPGLLLWGAQQPAAIAVLMMATVGVGMALPYLVLSAFPEAARRFPRVGPWSELFKQTLGFLVLAAAVYFAAGRLMSGSGFWWPVLATLAVGCLFLVARTTQLSRNAFPVGVSSAIAVVTVGLGLWWTITATAGGGEWKPYTKAAFDDARAAQKIVMVKFTANWCLTCQQIEHSVYTQKPVWDELDRMSVTPLKADLSALTDDPALDPRPLLTQLNPAGGIPLTAIFAPGRPKPIILASIYSAADLHAALQQIANSSPAAD